jgi:diguanylate cyclase (GGDEF)-like protein
VGKTGEPTLNNDLGWMLVRLHDFTQRIGSRDTAVAILAEASFALAELIGACGIAHYRLEAEGLTLAEEAGRQEGALPFPGSLVVRSRLGGVLAGTAADDGGDADPTSMPLGESLDALGIPALIEVLRVGTQGEVAGVLWIRREAQDDISDPVRSVVSVLVDHVGTALRMASMLAAERKRATIDDLTGLLLRAQFMREAHREISRSRRTGEPLSGLMIDVDHFKRVNDQHGHAAGDTLLTSLGRTLDEMTRETDVIGRLGGEEFGVLLPNADTKGAMIVAQRVRAAVAANPIVVGSSPLVITVSIGLACRQEPEDAGALFERADRAMYAAKKGGRDRVVAAQPTREDLD